MGLDPPMEMATGLSANANDWSLRILQTRLMLIAEREQINAGHAEIRKERRTLRQGDNMGRKQTRFPLGGRSELWSQTGA
eukprot:scaffold6124_cov242-Pinguiococcus_pyrenoidosus.AAC.2